MKRYLIIIVLYYFAFPAFTQIQVKPSDDVNFTPVDLINNIFLGEGVKIINIKYEGESKSVGYFSNGTSAVNIDRGIVMTTGESSVASLPNNSGGTQTVSSGQKYFDQDLSDAINNNQLYDVCKFEITFVPLSDSIRFNYVFASEEYPEFICSQYNDAFGFFISGANPAGGNYTGKNIALVPGTNEPVSINNVHPFKDASCQAKNEQFYNVNSFGSPTMTYDAYLDVFSAAAKVVPCTEYKIKLVIADVVDDVYDSAVFLEAKSFSTNTLKVSLNTPSYDATISEGCSSAEISFGFGQKLDSDYDLELKLLNDSSLGDLAIENIDFSPIPIDAKILKGQNSFSFDLQAYADNVPETEEVIALEYRKNVCTLDTLFLYVVDNKLIKVSLGDSVSVCQGDTVNVEASLPDTFVPPPDRYFNNFDDYTISGDKNSEAISTIKVNGFSNNILSSLILDKVCIDTFVSRVLSDFDFYLITPDNRYFELSTDNGFKLNSSIDIDTMLHTCFTPDAIVNINNGNPVVGDYFPMNPSYTGDFKPEGNWEDIWGAPIDGDWKMLVINDEQGWAGQLKSWHIAFKSNYKLSYNWYPNSNISCVNCLSPDIFPNKSGYYFIDYQDTYGCASTDSIFADLEESVLVPFLICDSISTEYIRFIWGVNTVGDTYEVRINGMDPWIETNDTFYEVFGLGYDESVAFEVRIKSEKCINTSTLTNCTTYPCLPPEIQLISITNVTCANDENGSIQLLATGTKPPYSFIYKTFKNNTGFFDNLDKGVDTIYIMDSDSCTIPYVFEIFGPDPIENMVNTVNIDCYGANNGSIEVVTTGGNGGYQYFWKRKSDGVLFNGKSLTGLSKSQYYLTVTDVKGCTLYDSVFIDEPDEIKITADIVNVGCKGSNSGAIYTYLSGGSGAYTFNWSTPIGDLSNKDIIGAFAGTYYLTVTDQNNCIKDTVFYITEPPNGLYVGIRAKDTLCYKEKDAWIALDIPNDKNYSILWNTGDISDSIYNLPPGRYSVTVTDSIGCKSILNQEIIGLDSIQLDIFVKGASCYDLPDGEAVINNVYYGNVKANPDKLQYVWNTEPPQYSKYVYGLQGGESYLVSVIDEYGCRANQNIFVSNPQEINVHTKRRKDVTCFGGNDGLIEIEYNEQDSLLFHWGSNIGKDSPIVDSLSAGLYKLTVTDANGCQTSKIFSITEPPEIQVELDIDDVRCKGNNDAQVKVNIKGGINPYLIFLDGEIKNKTITGLKKGDYYIQIMDNNNCIKTDSFEIDEPQEELVTTVESQDVSCYGGSDGKLYFLTFGGTPPYSYKVIGGDVYAFDTLIGLKSGKYSAVVFDVNGCSDTISNIEINDGQFMHVDLGLDTIVDYNSQLEIIPQITGGSSPFVYNWIVPEGVEVSCIDCRQPKVTAAFNMELRLVVEDSLGCYSEGVKNIFVRIAKGVFVPTAFIPNGNKSENRKVFVFGKTGIKINTFRIFDKWGGKVYERNNFDVNDLSYGWDGTFKGQALDAGNYSWYMEIENIDGTVQNFKGFITLIR